MELCGIKALSFAIGIYLPLSTTFPIFVGGAIRGIADWRKKSKGEELHGEEEDLGKGNLFATGLVAGGALAGVMVAILSVNESITKAIENWSLEHGISGLVGGQNAYFLLGAIFFGLMGYVLYKIAIKKNTLVID